jgi:putative transposase
LARMPRYAAPGLPQHVIQRGTNRSALFVAHSDYRFFRECLRTACEEHGCRVHAYVLMTNHVHLLVTPSTASGLGHVMQSVCRRYVRRFNDTHRRTGTLCQGRYKATVVDAEQYLFACYRYIELNPVRAGLVTVPGDYQWSSHRANALGVSDPLVTPHERYDALGPDRRARQAAYRALFEEALPDATLADIRDATNKGWALGSKRFRDEIAARLARRTEPARRGRRPRWNDEIRV